MDMDKFMAAVNAMTGKENYESIEELKATVQKYTDIQNRAAQEEFEGLSSDQVHRLLYQAFENTDDIVTFNPDIDPDLFLDAMLIKRMLALLQEIHQTGNLKATQTGALPRKTVVKLHDQFAEANEIEFTPRTELDSRYVHIPRVLLELAGWIKIRKKTFSTTAKGTKVVEKGFQGKDYLHLLRVYIRKYNWEYMTYMSDTQFCQLTALYSLRLVMKNDSGFTSGDSLFQRLIAAFPMALEVDKRTPVRRRIRSKEESLRHAFRWQVLEGFSGGFGLAELRYETIEKYKTKISARPSRLAKAFVTWHA